MPAQRPSSSPFSQRSSSCGRAGLCSAPGSSRPRPSRSEVRGIGAMKKQEAAAAVIDTLAEKWPNAFFADPQKRRPLKVGVRLDILQALPGVNKKTLSAALRFYTRHPCYVQAVVKGQARVDLSGVEVGPVSERDREMAAAELRKGAPEQEREGEARRGADQEYRPTGVHGA